MTHRGPFQPLLFCDSVIAAGISGVGRVALTAKGHVRSAWLQLSRWRRTTHAARDAGEKGTRTLRETPGNVFVSPRR